MNSFGEKAKCLRQKQLRLAAFYDKLVSNQLQDGGDFLLRIPSTLRYHLKPLHREIEKSEGVHICVHDYSVWLTSSIAIYDAIRLAKDKQLIQGVTEKAFRELIAERHPERLSHQCNTLSLRIRGEGIRINPVQPRDERMATRKGMATRGRITSLSGPCSFQRG